MKLYFPAITIASCLLLLQACKLIPKEQEKEKTAATEFSKDTATVTASPDWIKQANVYEVNVRQYTREGTFKAFAPYSSARGNPSP